MNFKVIISIIFFGTLLTATGFAKDMTGDHKGHDHKGHDHKEQKATLEKVSKEKLVIKVKGMVCAFCAQGIKKNFNKKKQVKKTEVDLDTMEVTVYLKPAEVLSEKEIKDVVTGAGFSYEGLKE